MSKVGAELKVHGVVQGVGYRYFFVRRARDLELTGWVRNRPDGTVESRVEGDRGSIEALISQLKVGPSSASVTRLDVRWTEATGRYSSFDVVG